MMDTSGKYWRPIRRDELRPERIHDPYRTHFKFADGTRCPDCGAVFVHGRWQWSAQAPAHAALCPACHRIRDGLPAGYLTLSGPFVARHRDELVRLMRHHESHEKNEHPLERIMAVDDQDGSLVVTTTDIHIARQLGDALHDAYKGELAYHYNEAENLLRISWTR